MESILPRIDEMNDFIEYLFSIYMIAGHSWFDAYWLTLITIFRHTSKTINSFSYCPFQFGLIVWFWWFYVINAGLWRPFFVCAPRSAPHLIFSHSSSFPLADQHHSFINIILRINLLLLSQSSKTFHFCMNITIGWVNWFQPWRKWYKH